MKHHLYVALAVPGLLMACRSYAPDSYPGQDEDVVTPVVVTDQPGAASEPEQQFVTDRGPEPPEPPEVPESRVEVAPNWVVVDAEIIERCPGLTIEAEEGGPVEPLGFFDTEPEVEGIEEPAPPSEPTEVVAIEPGWDALAECMNEGPLQDATVELVPYRREEGDPTEVMTVVADALYDAGIDRRRVTFDAGETDMTPPAIGADVMIRLGETETAMR